MDPRLLPRTASLSAGEFLRLELAFALLFVLLALAWAGYRGLPLDTGSGPWFRDAAAGLLAGAVFAGVNHWLLCHAPAVRAVRSLRRVYRDLKPLFSRLGVREVVVLVVAVGAGEELLYRGVMQAEFGLGPASISYGVLHARGPSPLAAGAWAGLMGAALGWLTLATGGLLAPFVAHTLYVAAAFAYVRRIREE